MIKTIIFDLGGVVLEPTGKEILSNASKKLGIAPAKLRKLIDTYKSDMQLGKISHLTFWKKISTKPEKILSKLLIEPYAKYSKVRTDIVELIKKLRTKYKIGCISNTQEPHISYNRKRKLFDNFDIVVLSSETGLRKPDKKIFELYLRKAKCEPGEAVFIDDEKDKLLNAKKIGIKTIHFKNPEQLRKKLDKLLN